MPTDAALAAGRRLLTLEAEALETLAARLDDRFVAAIDLLAGVRGRVIVTGMGKSGHVARRIAATLASTGTPAHYVHPGEASHGDLGMIAKGDAVIALSNSGETAELAVIVAHAVRVSAPLIAVTARGNSLLGEAARVALVLPPFEEACPLGLAPTTSTTMMSALGDALAVALLERRGFSSDDFRDLHPGGSLGQALKRVSDIMHDGAAVPLVGPDTDMADALVEITSKAVGCVGVVDGKGDLLGIITDGDLRRHMSVDLLRRPAAAVMTTEPKTIHPGALVAEALAVMNGAEITALFVVEGRRPVGVVHVHDCLRAGVA